MKPMTTVVKIALSSICLAAIAGTAYAGSVCTCEDWNNNGSFGVVAYQATGNVTKKIVKGDIGKYDACMSFKSSLNICTNNVCTCEDWDKDGKFGAVVYFGVSKTRKVLDGDYSNYYDCIDYKSSLSQCQ